MPRLRNVNKGDLVKVVWLDSYSTCAWASIEEKRCELTPCESVGWLIKVTKRAWLITSERCENEEVVGNSTVIPFLTIQHVALLQKAKT